jgi:hypothetical protein
MISGDIGAAARASGALVAKASEATSTTPRRNEVPSSRASASLVARAGGVVDTADEVYADCSLTEVVSSARPYWP